MQAGRGIDENTARTHAGVWRWFARRVTGISFRRITTQSTLIPQIDGLRFVALTLVLIDHILNEGGPIIRSGGLLWMLDHKAIGLRAVYLFFGLSGFILGLPFARQYLQEGKPVDIRGYFRRRVTRLEPPFLIAMILRLFALMVTTVTPTRTVLLHFAASIFYLHTAVFGYSSTINPPVWSLEIEVQFYIVAPLLMLLFRIRPMWFRRVSILGLIVASTFVAHLHPVLVQQRMFFSLAHTLQYFLAGMLACDLYVMRDFYQPRSWLWDLAGVGGVLYLTWVTNRASGTIYPFAIVVICLAAFYGHVLPRLLATPWVSVVGGMCYSIYLTHNSVLTGVHAMAGRLPGFTKHWVLFNALLFLFSFAAMLFVGTVFFVLFERPFMHPGWPSRAKAWIGGMGPRNRAAK